MTIGASRGRSLLVALLALGALRALALCELPAAAFAVAALAVVAIATHDILRARRPATLALDADGLWRHETPDGERFVGRLREAGYRSAALIVLELESEGGRDGAAHPGARSMALPPTFRRTRRRLAVFADGVDASDFSFLHLQLAFTPGGRSAR